MRLRVPLLIRWKILFAMLLIGIIPLVISASYDLRGLSQLGNLLGEQSGRALNEQTRHSLEHVADNYVRLIDNERRPIELLVRIQANQVERALIAQKSGEVTDLWTETSTTAPRSRATQTGAGNTISLTAPTTLQDAQITASEQVFYVPPPLGQAQAQSDAQRLQEMTAFYRQSQAHQANLIYRQYTALEAGYWEHFLVLIAIPTTSMCAAVYGMTHKKLRPDYAGPPRTLT